jgi:DnaJ-domain-containing protein 1
VRGGRDEVLRLLYRLGRQGASGVLTLTATGAPEVLVLRRGCAVCADSEPPRRALAARLARSASAGAVGATFDAIAAYPPGALHQVPLAGWVRARLEAELDGALAEALVRELAGARLGLQPSLAPDALDDADRRMLAALAVPRRLDQLAQLARAPRFRLLALVHFLRVIGALVVEPRDRTAAVRAPVHPDSPRRAAMRLLGIDNDSDLDAVKRAYHRLARALHPDLQPGIDDARRRLLERRFAEVTAAYETLV